MADVIIIGILIVMAIAIIVFHITNPFVRFTIVRDPHKVIRVDVGKLQLVRINELRVRNHTLYRKTAKLKSGWYIVAGRFIGGRRVRGNSVKAIIREIHKIRFNDKDPFIISGDHFSMLYPRSLGIFYHTLLDERTANEKEDWENRQKIYTKTTSYALEVFTQAQTQATTIVPAGRRSVVLMSIYTYPSDTLYSILYALRKLSGSSELKSIYKFETDSKFSTHTSHVARELLDSHKSSLKLLTRRYFNFVYDKKTGLIRKDRLLAGTKDMSKRKSAFYDNVVLWRLLTDAQFLGIIKKDKTFLASYKKRIIKQYWNKKYGYFNEDLDDSSVERYSSDWLIAYQTGFISPYKNNELNFFVDSVNYIQKNNIDQPFAIKYHNDYRPEQLYFWVKHSAKEYGSTTIWSHWGIEYIKVLIALYQQKKNKEYLEQAKMHLDRYEYNILRYKGYPEVYNEQGDIYQTLFYKSVLRTGWVVNYEQALAMYHWTKDNG